MVCPTGIRNIYIYTSIKKGKIYKSPRLKGQSHEKFGEMRARDLSLGHN
jgi:hypothetical protein